MIDVKFQTPVPGLLNSEVTVQPANKFIPKDWKNIPHAAEIEHNSLDPYKHIGPNSYTRTAKLCPSFPDVFNAGFVIPAPCDIQLYYDKEQDSFRYETGLPGIQIVTHGNDQMLSYAENSTYEFVFKLDHVWECITPPGYSIMQIPMLWHSNHEWEAAYGIIHTDQYHFINVQIMLKKGIKETFIEQGEPLCYIVPYRREEYNLVLQEWNEEESATAYVNNLGSFKNGYRKLFRKRNAKQKD